MKNYHFSYLFWYNSMVKSVELVATEALTAFRALIPNRTSALIQC
jgi:hypothetical protein